MVPLGRAFVYVPISSAPTLPAATSSRLVNSSRHSPCESESYIIKNATAPQLSLASPEIKGRQLVLQARSQSRSHTHSLVDKIFTHGVYYIGKDTQEKPLRVVLKSSIWLTGLPTLLEGPWPSWVLFRSIVERKACSQLTTWHDKPESGQLCLWYQPSATQHISVVHHVDRNIHLLTQTPHHTDMHTESEMRSTGSCQIWVGHVCRCGWQ